VLLLGFISAIRSELRICREVLVDPAQLPVIATAGQSIECSEPKRLAAKHEGGPQGADPLIFVVDIWYFVYHIIH
jgi:hypothetical protein